MQGYMGIRPIIANNTPTPTSPTTVTGALSVDKYISRQLYLFTSAVRYGRLLMVTRITPSVGIK